MYDPKRHVTTQVSARNAILRCFTSDQIKRLHKGNDRYYTRNRMEEDIHDQWRSFEAAMKREFEIVWKRAE
jgi:hypothetical protein